MTSFELLRDESGSRSMATENEYKYSVVEFLQNPPIGARKYVSVPISWIKTRRETDHRVVVQIPKGINIDLEDLIEDYEEEEPATDWPEYLCELKYSTQCHHDAKIYVMTKELEDTKRKIFGPKKPAKRYSKRKSDIARRKKSSKARDETSDSSGQDSSPSENNEQVNVPLKPGDFLKQAGQLLSETAKTLTKLSDLVISYAASVENATMTADDANVPETPEVREEEPAEEVENPPAAPQPVFRIPPDFDDNDTTWTLKYRQPGPDVLELMANSGVFVSKRELKACLTYARNSTQLIKYLLIAVFNENALTVCAVTGYEAPPCGDNDVRPGLDQGGKEAMLAFVSVYGKCVKWKPITLSAFNTCVRNRLTEFRRRALIMDRML